MKRSSSSNVVSPDRARGENVWVPGSGTSIPVQPASLYKYYECLCGTSGVLRAPSRRRKTRVCDVLKPEPALVPGACASVTADFLGNPEELMVRWSVPQGARLFGGRKKKVKIPLCNSV